MGAEGIFMQKAGATLKNTRSQLGREGRVGGLNTYILICVKRGFSPRDLNHLEFNSWLCFDSLFPERMLNQGHFSD
jgi:hypothetical protein